MRHRLWKVWLLFMGTVTIYVYLRLQNSRLTSDEKMNQTKFNITHQTADKYLKSLVNAANAEKVVILALIDAGFVDMAVNFWETSIVPHEIHNMLFVSLSKEACRQLSKVAIPCHVYVDFDGGKVDSTYMSPMFLKKMNMRTKFLLDALAWNFTVLNTDTDVLFFKNPLGYFQCRDCHLELLEDGIRGLLNAGFVYLRPTTITAEVYRRMAEVARKNARSEDQATLNAVIKTTMKGKVKYNLLDANHFMCGKKYYEDGNRYFGTEAKKCQDCVVVHNNWIVGKAAKIYRQKEMLQWVYDADGYYSDPNRRYIFYNNPVSFQSNSIITEEEKKALINALAIGRILNRTVILPKIHVKNVLRPWNFKFYISHIDDHFVNRYRESVFLSHPKVPKIIKTGLSEVFSIKSDNKLYSSFSTGDSLVKVPKDTQKGATSEEILAWFASIQEPVLRFWGLYGAFSHFTDSKLQNDFLYSVKDAFKKAVYRQY